MAIEISPHFYYIGESFEFLLGPALFMYTKSLAFKDFTLKKTDILHLIPFVIHLLFFGVNFHFYDTETKQILLNQGFLTFTDWISLFIAMHIHFLIYSILSIIIIYNYNSKLKNLFSNIEKIKLTWLRILVTGFIILWFTSGTISILNIYGFKIFTNQLNVSIVLLFIFSNLIMYNGLKYPEIFSGIKITNNNKFSLSKSKQKHYLQKLEGIMHGEKPYLDPMLSLDQLAKVLSIPSRYLSYVINNTFNLNFYDYINGYRIEESKSLLANSKYKNKTILDILYESGFNSKSVFNLSFKKHTGMTPSQYKKSVLT